MLVKPTDYKDIHTKQAEDDVLAEDANQMMVNIALLKGGAANEAPVSNIKQLKQDIKDLETKIVNQELPKKQDKLKAGHNIIIDKDNTIHSTGGSEGTSTASDVFFDNSIAKLQKLAGYDFPKFKTTIQENINLVLNDGVKDIPVTIIKKNNNYYLTGELINVNLDNYSSSLIIESINDSESPSLIYAYLSQFFEFYSSNEIEYNLSSEECIITDISEKLKLRLVLDSFCFITIKKQNDTNITGTHSINLNIANRVLKKFETNIFYITQDGKNHGGALKLVNNGSSVKLTGKVTAKNFSNDFERFSLYITNNIIENYFNIVSDFQSYTNTAGITSDTGKAVKYCVMKARNSDTEYTLSIKYQDGSKIDKNTIFTFNLTPDKNSTLNPIYQNVTNVQQAIETVNSKIDRNYNLNQIQNTYKEGQGGYLIYCMNIRDPDPTNNRNWVSNTGTYGGLNYIQCPESLNNKIRNVYKLEISTQDSWPGKTESNAITFAGGVGFAFIANNPAVSDYTKNRVIFYYDILTNRIYFKADEGVKFAFYIVNIYMEFTMNNTLTI